MSGKSVVVTIVTLGWFIYTKYIKPKDTRELRFLDDTHWVTTTVDHYYSGFDYLGLVAGLCFAYLLEAASWQ